MSPLFYRMGKNIAACFTRRNMLWQLLMIVATFALVMTRLDWSYFVLMRNSQIYAFLFPAVILGGLLPIIGPLLMLAVGKIKKNARLINAAWGAGQAALLGLLLSSLYKVFTGRPEPPHVLKAAATTLDISDIFRFGLFRGGVFWGWPSSHTTVAFASAIALAMLYPEKKFLKYGAVVYAAYVGLGVSVGIHWLSDAVAGVILGTIIGISVGHAFRGRYAKAQV